MPAGVAAAVFLLAVLAAPLRTPVEAVGRFIIRQDASPTTAAGPGSTEAEDAVGPVPKVRPGDGAPVIERGTSPEAGAIPVAKALRLAVVVPDGREGVEVVAAVRRAIQTANDAGGVGGRDVVLDVVGAGDVAALDAALRAGDVLVGGWGISPPNNRTWLLPADPHVIGPGVVAAEVLPNAAGVSMAEALLQRGFEGKVGVIIGNGLEAGLGDGIASRLPTETVRASQPRCGDELARVRRAGATALAIAGPASLVAQCAEALAQSKWVPAGGVMVPPSAAYAGLESAPGLVGSRTVLGLPWPGGDTAGAARFRNAVRNGGSYRALVSFAATELAVSIARTAGHVNLAAVDGGRWSGDLFELTGRVNTGAAVTLVDGRWTRDS